MALSLSLRCPLQRLSGLELRCPAGLDRQRLAGIGVPPHPSRSLGHCERAETLERHFLALGQCSRDRLEHGVDRLAGGVLGQAGDVGDVVDQIGFVHDGGTRRGGVGGGW